MHIDTHEHALIHMFIHTGIDNTHAHSHTYTYTHKHRSGFFMYCSKGTGTGAEISFPLHLPPAYGSQPQT